MKILRDYTKTRKIRKSRGHANEAPELTYIEINGAGLLSLPAANELFQ
jgi:hypothetical protein